MTFTVTIGTSPAVEVYAGLTAVDNYITRMVGAGAKKYRALITANNADERGRLLVSVTEWIERRTWQGTRSGTGGTLLAFPRTGVTTSAGVTIDEATQLADIAKAVGELVAIAAADNDVVSAADTGSNLRVLDGDGPRLEFFKPTSSRDGTALVMPYVVQQILGKYSASAASSTSGSSGSSGGTDGESWFDDCDGTSLTRPL